MWDTCWVNGISLIFIDPGRGRSFHTGLSRQQPGWKYQQQDVVFVRVHFPVLCLYKHAAIHQTCCHPFLFWLTIHSPFLCCHLVVQSLFSLSLFSPTSLCICNIPAVICDPGQSDGVYRFETSLRCCFSWREGQAGVGEGAGGGEEEGPQAHRDGKMKI